MIRDEDGEREIERRIDEIVSKGPAGYLTPWQRVERVILYILVAGVALALAGYFVNKAATSSVASCTNTQLGARSGLLSSLIKDLNIESKAQSSALATAFTTADRSIALSALDDYQKATADFTVTTTALVAYAQAHPLGKC